MVYRLGDLISLAVFTLGAIAFSILTVFYWGERRRRPQPGKSGVFPAFTLVCAAAFVNSLLFQVILPGSAGTLLATGMILWRDLTAALVAPLILHLVFETESEGLPRRHWWRAALLAVYVAGILTALAKSANQTGLLNAPWADELYRAPAAMLAAAAALGIVMQAFSRRPLQAAERSHRRWIGALLILMLGCAAANLAGIGAFVGQVPDYLLLVFFCVSLYYRERLVFFDVLVKRGAFLAAGLAVMVLAFAFRQFSQWGLWAYGAGLLLFWLSAPWVYSRMARAIDYVWLRRPYSPAEAERQFIRDIQAAANEDDLRERAAASLEAIFQGRPDVQFHNVAHLDDSPSGDDSLTAELDLHGERPGSVRLAARPNGVPFLSDDRRLLQSLAGALGVVLENVRFRAERRSQEQREQQLRWLASRAELKALRAQINPHFLFNSLSVIAGLMQYQPDLADETIERLAQVFRYTLRRSENEWAPLGEEVEFISAYLKIEQARFGERLHVDFDVQPAAARIAIPAMSIQPLIENAVKHGVSALEGRGVVELRAELHEEFLTIQVFDNGPGFPDGFSLDQPGDSHGLRNVADRLRGYYGSAAQLSWESGEDGTRVTIIIPQTAVSGLAGGAALDARTDCR